MKCPFCAEDIHDEATVCKHCHRDFSFAKSLLHENKVLAQKVDQLQSNVKQLNLEVNQIRAALKQGSTHHVSSERKKAGLSNLLISPREMTLYVLFPVLILLLLSYFFDIRAYASLIYLRLAAVSVSALLGYNLFWKADNYVVASIAIGAIVGTLTIAGMLIEVWLAHGGAGPIMLSGVREWQDAVEYSVSIMLATISGAVIGSFAERNVFLEASTKPDVAVSTFATMIAQLLMPIPGNDQVAERLRSIEAKLKAATAVLTAASALYIGLKGILP